MEGTGNDLQNKIDALKNKITNARELADRFKTGLTFYRNTTLELKTPESLPLLATSSKISLYFRTNKTNGFLLYLGNEEHVKLPRAKTHDFMALLIESGYPVLILDLGSGPTKVISNKFVADNVWRQIIVDRTGKNVKLIVREDIGEGKDREYETEKILPGEYSIFNVDQEHSKLFVGGYPSSFRIQDAITASSFEGEMEELVIGDVPISFWNFVDGENNREGAIERDKLINFQPSTGYRFDKHGYAILSKKNSQISPDSRKFSIQLNFKTFADNGLIYLMGKSKQFLSLEMRDGQVLYQYDLDDGEIALKSPNKYNDGKWHSLEALRFEKIGVLKIDGSMVARNEAQGNTKTLLSSDYIYFGGYPPNARHPYKPVTNEGFEGCIDGVVILDTSIDLSSNVQAFGVMSGCPARFESLVSFEDNMPGYVKWSNVSVSNSLQINLKFKTLANNGLIFYLTNPDHSVTNHMSLVDGVLIFRSQGEELRTNPAEIRFNDNEWHVVTATHNESSFRLDIDDIKNYSTDSPPPSLHILYGNLYIGGVPESFQISENDAKAPFVGCIGDATLNGVIINFANTTEKPYAFLGKCKGGEQAAIVPIDEPESNPWIPLLPTENPDDTTEGTTQINVVDIGVEKDGDEDEEPSIEGRGHHDELTTTESIMTSTQKTTSPLTVNQCHLPYYPATDPDLENAWRFGTANNSRMEYRSLNGRYKDYYDFQINVKTLSNSGIIFFAMDLNKQDMIAVYILDGRIHYQFNCGSGPALLISNKKIDDNQWHYVNFKRNKRYGELSVDNEQPTIIGSSQGHTETITVNPPFYVGGVLPELFSVVQSRIGLSTVFSGCLSNFMMNGQPVGEPTTKVGTIPCSERVEPGLFFFPGNGSNLFKALDRFTVGRTVDIQMDIKPRTTSGHLLSVHGKRDYLVLEMINGTIKFLVKTVKGSIETSLGPTKPNSLCDGNWHKIRAVKQKNTILLFVDQKAAPIGIGNKSVAVVLSRHPIFVGGHPLLGRKLRGSTSQAQYVGCINNILINKTPIHLGPERAYGEVLAGVCPTI